MKSVVFKIKTTKSSTYVKNLPKAYTLRCTSQKKSALRAKHTVKHHLGMGENWFLNQLRVSNKFGVCFRNKDSHYSNILERTFFCILIL